MHHRGAGLTIACFLLFASPSPATAMNVNEATGEPTNVSQIAGSIGDSISPYSGDLEISVPIGPKWELPGMSWGLNLRYSSKIWRLWQLQLPNDERTLGRRGPVGVGWRLTMGRVVPICRYGCGPLDPLYYEDSAGTLHRIQFDPTLVVPSVMKGRTTDGTHMRVEAYMADTSIPAAASKIGSLRIYPGNGVVLIFDVRPADAASHAGNPDDFGGWLLRRMEKRGPDGVTVESWVEVTYESSAALAHCIRKIEDGLGGSGNALRTITFTNATQKSRESGGVATVEGGYTTAITVPAVRGQSPVTATWNLVYENLRAMSFSQETLAASHPDQLLLSRVDEPTEPGWSGSYSYSFTYDPNTGELIRQTQPAGVSVEYAHSTYGYLLDGLSGMNVYVRAVVSRRVVSLGASSIWTYRRIYSASPTQNPLSFTAATIVLDPFGNQTRYSFYDPFVNSGRTEGLTRSIETYRGAPIDVNGNPTGPGRLVRKVDQIYQCFDPLGFGDVRLESLRTIYAESSQESFVLNSDPLPNGHFARTREYGFSSAILPERTTERVYEDPSDPALPPARRANWVTNALTKETIKDREGRIVRETRWAYLDDGKLRSVTKIADPSHGPSSDDVTTTYAYGVPTGLPELVTTCGGDDGRCYATRSIHTGPHLTGQVSLHADGTTYPYLSLDVTRDLATGLVLVQREPNGIDTGFHYDILGRMARVVPRSPELPTEITYVSNRQTRILRGPPTGDREEKLLYFDDQGRLIETRRLVQDATQVSQFTCYDAAGRPTFLSEWRRPSALEVPGSPTCPPPSGGPKGTKLDYTSYEDNLTATDPLGRVRKITSADGSRSETSYWGTTSTETRFNINGSPASGTGSIAATSHRRDAFGRLVFVDAAQGADARYLYDAAGELLRVELIEAAATGAPFVQVRAFSYDALGRLRSTSNPESGTVLYTAYDVAGNVLERIEPDGERVRARYDEAGRLLETRRSKSLFGGGWSPEVLAARYTYDGTVLGAGRLTEVESFDATGAILSRKKTWYVGLNGRPGWEMTRFAQWDARSGEGSGDPELWSCRTYDAYGRTATLRYPSRAPCDAASPDTALLQYQHSFGRLKRMNDARRNASPDPNTPASWTLIQDVVYDDAGGLKSLIYANGVTTTITPDSMYRPAQITVRGPGSGASATYLDTGAYTYDGAGNPTAIGSDRYGYDLAGRLVSATTTHRGTSYQIGWTVDDFGNILREDRTVNGATSARVFQVDPTTNRIVRLNGSPAYLYDQSGNLSRDDDRRYLFDGEDRLVALKPNAGGSPAGTYLYDAAGARILKEDPASGRRTFFVRDDEGNVLTEFVPSAAGISEGFWQKDHFYALGRIIGQAEEDVPRPVEGLTSSLTSSGASVTMTLRWASAPAATAYRIYRKVPTVSGAWVVASTVPSTTTSFVESFPQAEVRFYRVAAISAGGEGATSRGLRVRSGSSVACPDSSTVNAVVTSGSITLRWDRIPEDSDPLASEPSTTFLGYTVSRLQAGGDPGNPGSWTTLTSSPLREPRFDDLGVDEDLPYTYWIRAVDTSGSITACLAPILATPIDSIAPSTPVNVRASAGPGPGEVSVSWTANTEDDLAGYRLWRLEPDPNGGLPRWIARATAPPSATLVKDVGLVERITYIYALSAFDAHGNESALSRSVSARPRVAAPGSPMVTLAGAALGFTGASAYLKYTGAGNDASGYGVFRVFKKEQGEPDDLWSLVWEDPVSRLDDGSGNISTHFKGEFVDTKVNRCRVTQYVVGGTSAAGEETRDSGVYKVEWVLEPRLPLVSTQAGQVRFDPQGFAACASTGNGFAVKSWRLLAARPGDPNTYDTAFDPAVGYVLQAKPPSGQVWAYALRAEVQNLFETTDPNRPVLVGTFMSHDVCVDSQGRVLNDDYACPDLDGSRPVPTQPVGIDPGGAIGASETWQDEPMLQEVKKGWRTSKAQDAPMSEPAEGDAGWVLARQARPAGGTPDAATVARPGRDQERRSGDPWSPKGVPGSESAAGPTDLWDVLPPGRPDPIGAAGISPIEAGGLNPGRLVMTVATAKTFRWSFFSWDHLGSVRVVTDAAGAKVWDTKYLPYGEEMADPNRPPSENARRFTDHERDPESDIDYMLARYYRSPAGRFLSPDSVELGVLTMGGDSSLRYAEAMLTNPVRQNRYLYVWDSPLALREYSGNLPIHEFRLALSHAIDLIDRQIQSLVSTINYKAALFVGSNVAATVGAASTCAGTGGFACGMAITGLTLANAQLRLVAMEIAELQRQVVVWSEIQMTLGKALSAGNRGDWAAAEDDLKEARGLLRTLGGNPPKDQVNQDVDTALGIAQAMQQGTPSRNPSVNQMGSPRVTPSPRPERIGDGVVDWTRTPGSCYACQSSIMK